MHNVQLGFFEHNNRACWCGTSYPNHDSTDEQHVEQYPVVTQFLCFDSGNGNGWGREGVEAHAELLEDFLHDVGSGDSTQAVTVRVHNENDLLWLLRHHQACDEPPARL